MTSPSVPAQQTPGQISPLQPPPSPLQVGSVIISPQNAAVGPGQTVKFTATSTSGGTIGWAVNGITGGSAGLGSVDAGGNYTAPPISQSANVVVYAMLTSSPTANYATAPVALIQPGRLTGTANPQVADYSIYLPQPGTVAVQFGPDTGYGLSTWTVATPATPNNYGGQVDIQVAGMRASSGYHMRARVKLSNGVVFDDVDHTFKTGPAPPTAPVDIAIPAGQTPQPGIELFNTVPFNIVPYPQSLAQVFATDISGHVVWTYNYTGSIANTIFPIKLLPNGHFLMVIGYIALPKSSQNIPPDTVNAVREIDLAGNTIRELTVDTLNQSMATAGFTGLNLLTFHNDILVQPNGHWLLLAWMTKAYTNLPGFPGTTNVLGDVIVDVDEKFNPTWVWNSFDHLDINRHPFLFPDWTHGNALLYSPDDYNLLLSLRNQNWIIKIDYQDGTGTGNVIWRLGAGGDFSLVGGQDPTDWFYSQHGPNYFGATTTGDFTLGVFDDGNDRQFPAGVTCGSAGAPPCLYSTVPVLKIVEAARTATLVSHYVATGALYSNFGGQVDLLGNGNIEADFSSPTKGAVVQEYTSPSSAAPQTNPSIVWQATTPGYNQYRAYRISSLYPGIQW